MFQKYFHQLIEFSLLGKPQAFYFVSREADVAGRG